MTAAVVSTPSRLHFGLLRLHETEQRSFGGLGMMIDRPRVEVEISAAEEWRVTGPSTVRALAFAKRALAAADALDKPPALCVRVDSVIRQHRGLGGGTQLALALAAGVRRLLGLPGGSAAELAAAAGRGGRSAVGSHGFVHGGLIWEKGRTPHASLAELETRVDVPADWRFLLMAPQRMRGLSGAAETRAFAELPPAPAAVSRRLSAIAELEILPAARRADVDAFGQAVFEYGRRSGELFAAVQGGPYASPEIAALIATLRAWGVRGAGQSSWGPTVFAVAASDAAASELIAQLRNDNRWPNYAIEVAAPDNRGAVVCLRDCTKSAPRDYSNP